MVIDRSQLILDSSLSARSRAKVRFGIGALKYLLPRLIAGRIPAFSRLAGVIAARPARRSLGQRAAFAPDHRLTKD